MRRQVYIFLALCFFIPVVVPAQTLERLKELSTGFGNSNPYSLTVVNDKLFFIATNAAFHYDLYVTDGTEAGTLLIGPPGVQNFSVRNLIAFNNKLFFVANDGTNGVELWVSDGTVAGTSLFKDLYPGSNGSFPDYFTVNNGKLFFMGIGVNGERRLYVSDGTVPGTTILYDNYIDMFNGNITFPILNNDIYFKSFDNDGWGLWKSNGTTVTRVKGNFHPGIIGCNYAVLNNKLYFSGDDNVHGSELCVTDGTSAGTYMVKNLKADGGGVFGNGSPQALTVFNSKLYFGAADDAHGFELFVSDGTDPGTQVVKDILPGTDGGAPNAMTVYNGQLYFFCARFSELWKSDGTELGTQPVKTVQENTRFGAIWDNKMYLISGTNPYLWQSDGTAAGTGAAIASNTSNTITIFATDYLMTPFKSNLYFGGQCAGISLGNEPLRFVSTSVPVHNFSFTGSGNWSNPANWAGGLIPPATLLSGDQVVINGNCILDIAVYAQPGSSITIAPGQTLLILGSLTII